MSNDPLMEDIAQLAYARLLCVGDIMLDRFVYGVVERISPESPVPILRVTDESVGLGGAGNVAHNVSTLGATLTLVGAVGEDVAGEEVIRLLKALPNCEVFLSTDAAHATTVKTRCVGANQQMLRIDRDPTTRLSAWAEQEIIASSLIQMPTCDVVVLSDYGKGVLSTVVLERLLTGAKRLGKPTVVDPKGADFARYRGATMITPNLQELRDASQQTVETDADVEHAARQIMELNAFESVLVTRSEKGMTLVRSNSACDHIPTVAQQVYDVSGAGDTVAAVFATALGAGVDILRAVQLSNLAAGVVVSKLGTAAVGFLELETALRSANSSPLRGKLLTLAQVKSLADEWRSQGKRVGFTNGCFDLLHPGHVKLFNAARDQCERLIVGLNDDASVRRLKGETRPIQDEISRATILASLSPIDALVLFAQATPLDLIKAIKPDVLIKGADYRLEEVVGADVVMGYGGEVHLVPIEEGHSTTRLIDDSNT